MADPQPVDVMIESAAAPGDVKAVRDVFAEFGIKANVEAAYDRRSVDLPAWAVIMAVPLGPFLTAFASAAGSDAWRSLKAFVERLCTVRSQGKRAAGVIEIRDPATHTIVILSDRIPDEGFQAVFDLQDGGHYVWDSELDGWRRS